MSSQPDALDPTLAATTLEAILEAYEDFNSSPSPPYKPSPPLGYTSYFVRLYGWEGIFFQTMEKFGLVFQSGQVPGQYMVAFRGTQTATEWVLDFDWTTTPFPGDGGVEVAAGFLNIYTGNADGGFGVQGLPSMRQQLQDWLTQANPSSLIITGHSLGGALASLFAYDVAAGGLAGTHSPAISVVTYASPNVGTAAWQSAFNNQFPGAIRVYNTDDVVPFAPPDDLLGYLPVGLDWPVEFDPSNWFDQYQPDALGTNHSCDNYRYVVNLAASNTPPIWTGNFQDQSDLTSWIMQSWQQSAARGAQGLQILSQYMSQLKALGPHPAGD
jgi:triacylglycerol lipase